MSIPLQRVKEHWRMVEPIMGNLSENCSFQAEVVEYSFEQEAFQWKE